MAIPDRLKSKVVGVFEKLNVTPETVGSDVMDNVRQILIGALTMSITSVLSLRFLRNRDSTAPSASRPDVTTLQSPPGALELPVSGTGTSINPVAFFVQSDPLVAVVGLAGVLLLLSLIALFVVSRLGRLVSGDDSSRAD